ncbi:helix-turn-helix domain-containing protein [Lachnospiraceae bacterium 38-14]
MEKIEITGTDPVKIVRSILEQEELNQQKLADKMGVARQNVSQALNRNRISMRFDNFEKMVSALGYEIVVRKK